MNKKLQREINGPSWTEVILGAVLSLMLGAMLAAAFLVLKPVSTVKELPKEPVEGTVYYLEGSRDTSKARQVAAKQNDFIAGGSIVLNEDELNVLASPNPAAASAAGAKQAAAPTQTVSAGSPNFRVRDGVLQIAVPVRLNVAGLDQRVIVQARGGFAKRGEIFVFAPDEILVGSCPLQRLPAVPEILMKRFLGSLAVPEEIAAAWRNVSEVKIEGSTLQLTL